MRPIDPRGPAPRRPDPKANWPGRRGAVTRGTARLRSARLSSDGRCPARRSGPGGDVGALTLSYIVVLPVFLASIMTIVQASAWYLARQAALAAARHGADVARTANPPPGTGAQSAIDFATSAAPGFLLRPHASVRVSANHTVTVTVTGQAPSLVPGLPIHISEVVTAPVERFVAAGPLPASNWGFR